MLRSVIFLICLLSSGFIWGQPNEALPYQIQLTVEKFKLDNGMVVLLHEDHSAPIVNIQQWYRVGSRNELPGQTGLAHFFEHIMFKGTSKHPSFNGPLRKLGISSNAFTSFDYTGYHETLLSGLEEIVLDLESDRMRNLLFKQEEINSEREVVKEERRVRTENSVHGSLSEAMFKTLFKVHPYKSPIIGSMKDLNAATIEDMKAFYKTYYAPNNSVLVISGNISIPEVTKWVHKYYGDIPPQALPKRRIPMEPQQKGQRRTTLKRNVQATTFAYAYKGARRGKRDSYALTLLTSILGSGQSSRLHRSLVRGAKLSTMARVYSYKLKDSGLFAVMVSMIPKKSVKRAQSIVLREIEKLRSVLVSDKELEKAKNMEIKSYVDGLKSISGKGELLAWAEVSFGDYTQVFKELEKYQSVTKEDILEVAKKYLSLSQGSLIQVVKK